jgi:hypothetical protein
MGLPQSPPIYSVCDTGESCPKKPSPLNKMITPPQHYVDAANPLRGRAADLEGTIAIDRTPNRDGSITVTRSRIIRAEDVTIQTPQGPITFPLATLREPMGSIRLLPQRTANGAPATPTPAMETRLLNLSQQIGMEVRVSSGIRTVAQQEALRGNNPNTVASVSQHNVGDAADISANGLSGRTLAQRAVASGLFERVNLYPTGAVHVDQRNVGPGTQYYENWARQP